MHDDGRNSGIRAARSDFLQRGGPVAETVNPVVAASWSRSRDAGIDLTSIQPSFFGDPDKSTRLVRCSTPIIAKLRDQLGDMPLTIALTDSRARILDRWDISRALGTKCDKVSFAEGFGYTEDTVGTNGVGTVLNSGYSVLIAGSEHLHEGLQPFTCAGAPIRDPVTGRVEGVLDITALAEQSSPLMHTIARTAAHDIERNLLIDRSQCQQALFETFMRLQARTHHGVLAIGGAVVMGNATYHNILNPLEQQSVQEHVRFQMTRHSRRQYQISLDTGKELRLRGSRIMVGNDVAGMVVEVVLLAETQASVSIPEFGDRRLPMPVGSGAAVSCVAALTQASPRLTEGQSVLLRRAADELAAALRSHQPVLVMGETGTGKFSLTTEIYHRVQPSGRSVAFEAGDIGMDTYDEAEEALEAVTVPTLYVFRNIDGLHTGGVERLSAFLLAMADTDRPAYVAATLSDASLDSDLPFRDLLPLFQRAVTVPPLRHRIEDLPAITEQILHRVADRDNISIEPAAMRVISRYSWPRNIPQLEEALRSALLKRPVGAIQSVDLPGYCHDSARRQLTAIESVERDAIVRALHDSQGNRVEAAQRLGIARSSLYRKLKAYGIKTL